MQIKELSAALSSSSYPGRGIVLGRSGNGRYATIAYFIMGRSENSRNRIFVTEGNGIRTKAFDESKMEDPSLIIYSPVRVFRETTIVTNGDQTDTIYDTLTLGKTFEDALRQRTFEPDAPNFTPRISGVICEKTGAYCLSILKSNCHNADSVQRFFFDYSEPKNGQGHLIHTYQGDGSPLPSFEGEPVLVAIPDDLDACTQLIWESLDRENRVSLFTRTIDLTTGQTQTRIVNKNQK